MHFSSFQFQYVNFLFALQSSTTANVKEIDGGIGQRFLEVDVETDFIDSISYEVHVYGDSSTTLPSLGLLLALASRTILEIFA